MTAKILHCKDRADYLHSVASFFLGSKRSSNSTRFGQSISTPLKVLFDLNASKHLFCFIVQFNVQGDMR